MAKSPTAPAPSNEGINENGGVPTPSRADRVRSRAYSLWEDQGRPEGKQDEHWLQAEQEIGHGMGEIEGDDLPRLDALREAAREHADTFLVKSDLDDADQREASPGTREQP